MKSRKVVSILGMACVLALIVLPAKAHPMADVENVAPIIQPAKAPSCAAPTRSGAQPAAMIQVANPQREKQRLDALREVNYYPAEHPWPYMWTNWAPKEINTDFGRIEALHGNSVRLILQAGTIGYPTPHPRQLAHLAQAIALAHKHHLTVQLTLFDWWSSYKDISGSKKWICAVIGPYAGDHRISSIELQNEIDVTAPGVIPWIEAMMPYLRSIDGGIPLDLSTYQLNYLQTLVRVGHADFYSFHLLEGVESSHSAFMAAMKIVAPAPLYIGEAGTSTLLRWAPGKGCQTLSCIYAVQDHNFRIEAYAAHQLGLPPIAPWTLTDFAPHTLTWNPPPTEYDYGLFQTNGIAKPVAATVSQYFTTGKISTSFNSGFETAAGKQPAEWLQFHGWEGQFARDATVSHSGHASARIRHSTSDSLGGPAFYLSPIHAGVTPGHSYTLGVWARGRNLTGQTRAAISWFDIDGNYLGEIQSPTLATGTTNWTHLTVTGVAPPHAAYVQLHLKSFDNKGTAWFDDVTYS